MKTEYFWNSFECSGCDVFLDVRVEESKPLVVACPFCKLSLETRGSVPAVRATEGGFGSNADYDRLLIQAAALLELLPENIRNSAELGEQVFRFWQVIRGIARGANYFDSPTLGQGKLVRDGVAAEIVAREGDVLQTLPRVERVPALLRKLREEAAEAEASLAECADALGEELADVATVVEAICLELFITLEGFRQEKNARRGRFAKFLFLRAENADRYHAGGGK